MGFARRVAFVLLAALALSGCALVSDADQARICRTAIVALEPEGAAIRVLRQTAARGERTLRVDYAVSPPGATRFIICRFAAAGQDPNRLVLTGVATQRGRLGEAQLLFLRRFWLETREAAGADPSPARGAETAPSVGPRLAYAMQQGVNALAPAAIYGLLACAYALVYGLIGRINLAFGELAAAGGYAALLGIAVASGAGPWTPVALAASLAVWAAATHGLVSARAVFLPLRRASGQQALVATVGLSLFLQEYLRLAQGSALRWVSPFLAEPIALARAGDFIVTVTPIALLAGLLACLAAFATLAALRRTRFGRDWRAYADDPEAAALFGVDPAVILMKTFALASALAGLAGFVMTIHYGGVGYGSSTTLGLKALIAAILGGIGSAGGAFLGGVLIGFAEAGWSAMFSNVYRDAAVYALLVAVLVFRPGGLFGYGDLTPRRV